MSEQQVSDRPGQVTMGGFLAFAGSVLLVVSVYSSIGALHSVDMREGIADFLGKPPGDGLGLSVPAAISLIRIGLLVAGAVAAASVVLAVYVLQRHRAARLWLSVAAVLLLITAPFTGGFLALLVAFAAALLWTPPARDWFAGRTPRPAPARTETREVPRAPVWPPPPEPERDGTPQAAPPPYSGGFGSPTSPQGGLGAEAPTHQPLQAPAQQQYAAAPGPSRRPTGVTVAAVLTWIFSGVTALVYLLLLGVLLLDKEQVVGAVQDDARFQELGLTTDQLVALLWVVSAIVIFWCLAAMVLAVLVLKRQNWARIVLVVSAAMSAVLAVFALVAGVPTVLAAIATIILLFVGDANAWFAARPAQHPHAQHPSPRQPERDEQDSDVW